MRFPGRAEWLRVLRCALLVVWLVGGAGAWAQQLVTDAPVAKPGGTAYVGKYTAASVFSAGPAFHFTAPVTIMAIAFDPGPSGEQELTVRSMSGCPYQTEVVAGTVCGIETKIASQFPGLRFGTFRVTTTAGVFTVPVEWESIGAQIAVTPGTLSTPPGVAGVIGNALALDPQGNIYLSGDNVVRKVDAMSGAVSVIAGVVGNAGRDGDGGPATVAAIGTPINLTVSPAGDVYVVSSASQAIDIVRKVDGGTGIISTAEQFLADPAVSAGSGSHNADGAVAVDDQGNMYTSKTHTRALTAMAGTGGVLRYLIGGAPDGSQGCNAGAGFVPTALAVNRGSVYFASGAAVYKISTDGTSCHQPVLVAGTGAVDSNGDGGLATKASIGAVTGIALDAAGNVYLADATNGTVRMVSATTGLISTIAGVGSALPRVTVAPASSSLAVDVRGNLYILSATGTVQKIDVSGGSLSFADTKVGEQAGGSATRIAFTNIGNDVLATAVPVVSANFALNAATSCGKGVGARLGAGESCEVAVDFLPKLAGVLSGTLAMDGVTVALRGNATGGSSAAKGSYSVTVNPAQLSLSEGQSGTATFVFAPSGGFAGRISLTCSGLPDGVECSFAPATLTADGTDRQQTSVMTVTTRTASALVARGTGLELASLVGLNGMLIGWLRLRRRGQFPLKLMSVFLLLSTGVAGMTGCGSGGTLSSLAPMVSTKVSVVTTSMADGSTQTATFMLTVK